MDRGYFPQGHSVLHRVQAERMVGLHYGQRALLIGALHPVSFMGTSQSTTQRDRPWRRLVHTGRVFETIFFGTRSEADRALAMVHRMHGRSRGTLTEAAGAFPKGTPYSAFDAKLMLWTIAVAADSAQVFYELFVRKLSDEERDGFWRDWVTFGELFGMPRDAAPPSYVEFRRWYRDMLHGPEMFLTPYARRIGMQVAFSIPLPSSLAIPNGLQNLFQLGSLPERVRELYGLPPWSASRELAFRAATRAMRESRRLLPRGVRNGSVEAAFDLIERRESQLAREGKQAMLTDEPAAPP
jgi:uncharacterized protein (DUF2236 family)